MDKQFLKECLKHWESERGRLLSQIKRCERGERLGLLSFLYKRGDLHTALNDVNTKIHNIKSQL